MEVAYYWIQESIKPYADHHEVAFENDALRLAVKLSKTYIHNRFLPDKVSCPRFKAISCASTALSSQAYT